jgi:hypothetical protein
MGKPRFIGMARVVAVWRGAAPGPSGGGGTPSDVDVDEELAEDEEIEDDDEAEDDEAPPPLTVGDVWEGDPPPPPHAESTMKDMSPMAAGLRTSRTPVLRMPCGYGCTPVPLFCLCEPVRKLSTRSQRRNRSGPSG